MQSRDASRDRRRQGENSEMKTFSMTKQYITVYVLRDWRIFHCLIAIALAVDSHSTSGRFSEAPDLMVIPAVYFRDSSDMVSYFQGALQTHDPGRPQRGVQRRASIRRDCLTGILNRSRRWSMRPGMAELKHENGKVRLGLQIDGFYEFLWTLKKLNPNIEIRGC